MSEKMLKVKSYFTTTRSGKVLLIVLQLILFSAIAFAKEDVLDEFATDLVSGIKKFYVIAGIGSVVFIGWGAKAGDDNKLYGGIIGLIFLAVSFNFIDKVVAFFS